jgi:hypothetical protein
MRQHGKNRHQELLKEIISRLLVKAMTAAEHSYNNGAVNQPDEFNDGSINVELSGVKLPDYLLHGFAERISRLCHKNVP